MVQHTAILTMADR